MSERQVKEWITINGKHVPIFEGESKQDAYNRSVAKLNEDKRQTDIEKNQAEAEKLNKDTDYNTKKKLSNTFTKNTGVAVTDNFVKYCNQDSMKMIFDTLEKQIKDIKNLKIGRVDILQDKPPMADSEDWSNVPAAATNDTGLNHIDSICFNTDFFNDLNALEKTYQESVQSGLHPPGDTSSIIMHEVGHLLVTNKIKRMFPKDDIIFKVLRDRINKFLSNRKWGTQDSVYADKFPEFKKFKEDFESIMYDAVDGETVWGLSDDFHEVLADAYADYGFNKDKASKVSKQLCKLLLED